MSLFLYKTKRKKKENKKERRRTLHDEKMTGRKEAKSNK
jgi:hypothetical protein